MANYRKSFNLRNGVQVDDDNFIVNPNGLVGIGTSIPTELLEVIGTAKVVGLVTASRITVSNLSVPGIGTFTSLTDGIITINSGIISATVGVATFYGDGAGLINIPTSQWIDVNTGLGITSIYAAGAVGVATNYPYYYFQVGGNPDVSSGVGFNSTGDIKVTGFVTAFAFNGNGVDITGLNANNISSGTLSTSRLPSNIIVSGIITAGSFVGNLTGTASTADQITPTSIISISGASIGVATVTNNLNVNGKIGVGTNNPVNQVQVRQTGISSIHVQSTTNESSISVGRSDSFSNLVGKIRFGNTNLSYLYSTDQSLDIINYDDGNINHYLQYGSTGVSTGNFNWIYGQNPNTPLMTLTYDGKLGINQVNPTNTLHVVGTSTVTGNSFVGGASTISGDLNVGGSLSVTGTFSLSSQLIGNLGVSTSIVPNTYQFQVGGNPNSTNGVGINSTGNIRASGIITATTISATTVNSTSINASGTITAATFGNGTGSLSVTSIGASSINATNISLAEALDLSTINDSAFYPPIMTTAERNAFTAVGVSSGAMIYNTDVSTFQGYDGLSWVGFSTSTIGSSGGKVIQVATGRTSTSVNHSSGQSSTGLSASITLSSASNKVMVYITQPLYTVGSTALTIKRSQSGINTSGITTAYHGGWTGSFPSATFIDINQTSSISYLDSPGSLSTFTYETYVEGLDGASCTSNAYSIPTLSGSYASATSTITLMEILA